MYANNVCDRDEIGWFVRVKGAKHIRLGRYRIELGGRKVEVGYICRLFFNRKRPCRIQTKLYQVVKHHGFYGTDLLFVF